MTIDVTHELFPNSISARFARSRISSISIASNRTVSVTFNRLFIENQPDVLRWQIVGNLFASIACQSADWGEREREEGDAKRMKDRKIRYSPAVGYVNR